MPGVPVSRLPAGHATKVLWLQECRSRNYPDGGPPMGLDGLGQGEGAPGDE